MIRVAITLIILGLCAPAWGVAVDESGVTVQFSNIHIGFNAPMGIQRAEVDPYGGTVALETISDMPIYALRYAGGTVANFFDWDSGVLFLDQDWINAIDEGHSMRTTCQGAYDALPVGRTDLPFDGFLGVNSTFKPFVVLNVFMDSAVNAEGAADYASGETARQIYWEIGNEMSDGSYINNVDYPGEGVWSVSEYLIKTNEVIDHIETNYSDDKIGVCGRELLDVDPATPPYNWETAVSGVTNYSDIDAIIYHPYINASDDVRTTLLATNDGAPSVVDGFATLSDELLWRYVFAAAQERPGRYVTRLNNIFSGKKLWITEIGLLGSGCDVDEYLRTLALTAYLISIMEHEEIESCIFHQLASSNSGIFVVRYGDYSLTANGLAYAFMNAVLEDADLYGTIDISSGVTYQGAGDYTSTDVEPLSVLCTKDQYGTSKYLIVNSGPDAVTLEFSTTIKHTYTFDSGTTKTISSGDYTDLTDFIQDVNADSLEIQPFSITVAYELDTYVYPIHSGVGIFKSMRNQYINYNYLD
jgi:hypothetical protein